MRAAACFAPPADLGNKIAKASIEADAFNLVMRTLRWEMQAHDVWVKKCAGVENSNAWAKQDAKLTLKKTSTTAVQRYVSGVVKLMVHESSEDTIREIMDYKRGPVNRVIRAPDADGVRTAVPHVPLLNWAAPCQLHADFLAAQLSVLTWALAENPNSCGVVVQPAFSYNKGKLILEEKKVLTLLQ